MPSDRCPSQAEIEAAAQAMAAALSDETERFPLMGLQMGDRDFAERVLSAAATARPDYPVLMNCIRAAFDEAEMEALKGVGSWKDSHCKLLNAIRPVLFEERASLGEGEGGR